MTELTDKIERAEQQQAGQLARDDDARVTIFDQLRKMEPQFAAALPRHIDPGTFVRVAVTELRLRPELQTCSAQSLMGALMLSAQLGLVPGPLGHVYLVPYGNRRTRQREVEFQIGYKGYIELAARSGISIEGHTVREGDSFDFELGTTTRLMHKPRLRGQGDAYAWWVKAERATDGRVLALEVLDREQVESYRARSKAKDSGPWTTDYDAMALKTVVRRMVKWLPLDTERADSFTADESRPLYQPGTQELTITRPAFDDVELVPDPDGVLTTPEDQPEAGAET